MDGRRKIDAGLAWHLGGVVCACFDVNLNLFTTTASTQTPPASPPHVLRPPIHDHQHHGPRKISQAAGPGRRKQDRCVFPLLDAIFCPLAAAADAGSAARALDKPPLTLARIHRRKGYDAP